MLDVYLSKEYATLYETSDNGRAEEFVFSNDFGEVHHVFLKKKINIRVDDTEYFDLISPYGYAGPYISKINETDEVIFDFEKLIGSKYEDNAKKLLHEFFDAFRKYCQENSIVSEFIRFNPLINNAKFGLDFYNPILNRNTIAVNIENNDYKMIDFTSKCRNTINKAYKLGIQIEVDQACKRLDEFIEIYNMTMQKDNAEKYYFFDKEYYVRLKNLLKERMILIHAVLDGRIISSSIFMMSDYFMHYHLSGTKPEFYSYSANNAILDKACEIGHQMGLKLLHLGGGTSSSEENSLYKFKKQFGRTDENKRDFYLGKYIYNQDIYDKLVKEVKNRKEINEKFFPLYRG